ncbi:hypothetical protein BGX27_007553 [Mortierella sp. AM989]|nr:hypothetical protein BGX27_007553 [Mortierella sp. AM989]
MALLADPTNPLEIFEVVAMIGGYFNPWKYDTSCGFELPEFLPKDILSCTLVSKTWRAALLPILWEVYDGGAMSSISNEVVSKYSHYFKYITNWSHPGPFYCNRLCSLEIEVNNIQYYQMIKELQPPITSLTLIHRSYGSMLELSEVDAKISMIAPAVTHLVISQGRITTIAHLLEVLTGYSQLCKLSLDFVHRFDESLYSESTMTSIPLPQPYLVLPSITTLHLCCSETLFKMVICCPNLNRLEIIGPWVSWEDIDNSPPIYHYCPRVRSLSIILHEIDTGAGRYMPNDDDLAELIINLTGPPGTGKLNSFEATLAEFGSATSQALAIHAKDTLENFKLILEEAYDIIQQEPYDGFRHILSNCHRLKKFSVQNECEQHKTEYLDGQWACLDSLEELEIRGDWYRESPQLLEDIEVSYGDGGVWIWCGERNIYAPLGMLEIISANIKQMPRLCRLSIGGNRFYKVKKIE